MSLQALFGIDLPIIQAPMAGVQGSAMAIAVCNAGGLGSLPCAMLDSETIGKEITTIQAQTRQPYNLNFFCHTPPEPDEVQVKRWRNILAPYYAEYEIDPDQHSGGAKRTPFNAEIADLLAAFAPPIMSFHFGLPAADLLARVRGWGAKILGCATTVEEARWLAAQGVDAIIAQGSEAGGHRGMFLTSDVSTQVGTFALVPQIVAAVNVPVIAAGGIADAQGVKAALALGAVGVQVGTAYLLCDEATTSPVYRVALQSPAAHETAITNVFTGRPARGIVNRLMRDLGPMSDLAPAFPLAAAAVTPLRSKAESLGSGDFTSLWAGQNVTGCQTIPAAEMTRQLASSLV